MSAIIAAIWSIGALSWILTDRVVPWDSKTQFYAFFRFLASALHEGHSPFWNPYHYGGHPAVADPQSLIFAPAFVLWALIDAAPSIRVFDLIVYAHLLVGGLAIAVLGQRAGWPIAASVLAAAVFMLGGPAAGRLQHTGIILSYGLFPVALLLLQVALQRRSILTGIVFAFVASALLLGRNQVSLLLCFVLVAAALAEIAVADRPLTYLRERAVVLAVMLVAGLAMTAGPMLLTLQFAALSNRPVILLETALEGSLYPLNAVNLVAPNVFGSLSFPYWGPNWETVPDVASTDDSFNYIFVGSVPVLLLLWLGIAGRRALRPGSRLIAAVLVASTLYMVGRYTPLFGWMFAHVPGIDLFRRPVDATFVFIAMLALLSGHLLATYMREGRPRLAWLATALIAACAIGLLAWAVAFSAATGHATQALRSIAIAAAVMGLAILVLALPRSERARRFAAAGAVAVALAELLWWNSASRLNAEPRSVYQVLEKPSTADAKVLEILEKHIAARHRLGERPRVEIVGITGAWQNLAVVRGLEATNGYNPLRIGFYDRLVSPGETTWHAEQRLFPPTFDGYDSALARALGLEYVVLSRPIEQFPRLSRRPVVETLLAGPKVWIYRLTSPRPRVKFSPRVQIAGAYPRGQILAPSPERVLLDAETPPSRPYGAKNGEATARITSWRPGHVEIEVNASAAGVLVFHGTYYPGWTAEVDGRRTRLLRADLLFRGVEVPAGAHRVVLHFAPFSLDNLSNALWVALGRT